MIRTTAKTLLAVTAITAATWLGAGPPALAADVADSADNKQLERFPGSEIAFYKLFKLDEAFFLRAPMGTQGPVNYSSSEWLRVEGRVTQIRYTMPANTSSLAAYRDIENKLKAKGFRIVFGCRETECLANGDTTDQRFLGERMDPHIGNPMMYFDRDRYLLARLDQPGGPVYVSALIGERREQSVAFVQVLEPEELNAPPRAPEAKTAACPQLFGEWRNIDPKTRSIPRTSVKGSCDPGARIVLRVWGACTPKECDWGDIPAQFDQAKGEITATTKVSFEVTQLGLTLDNAGRLVIKSSTHFTDKTGRPDMQETDVMQR